MVLTVHINNTLLQPLIWKKYKAQILTFLVKKFLGVFARVSYVAGYLAKQFNYVSKMVLVAGVVRPTVRLKQVVACG